MPGAKVAGSGDSFLRLSGGTLTGPLVLPLGSSSAPSLTFDGDTDTGLYRPANNEMGFTQNSNQVAGNLRLKSFITLDGTTDGKWRCRNGAQSAGVVLDLTTDNKISIRNRADSAAGDLDAAGGSVKEVLLASLAVDVSTTAKQTLYTVPTGKTLVVTKVFQRSPSGTLTGTTSGNLGGNVDANDWYTGDGVGALGANQCQLLDQGTGIVPVFAAGTVFGWKSAVAEGSAITVQMSVFGYLF